MKLLINGEKHDLEVTQLDEVVAYFELEAHLVVTELNGEIIEQEKRSSVQLIPESTIELVHFVGGG
ncbi:sulfur carrier protein ThiS [Alkalihalobacillus pseudalcaliphilus]|uniref:sulfur carrier protein ThiS n=1 Tax=Alkalihalobacillus pseudalcaliphilus TaxID=79884 RepID=UPI00064DF0D0|nr:sulfur carrier protein ThiS [Alkalihalobacillus pseudalcaliphilus]KMK76009.1 thiamine biosynthesis protein ThiS [Alkalihalobacillus pseudalcaliphilus]